MEDGDGDVERQILEEERERILRELADLEESDEEEEESVPPQPIPDERRFEDESLPTCSSSITRNDTLSIAEVSTSSSSSNSCDTYTNVIQGTYDQQNDTGTMFILDGQSTSQSCPFSKSQENNEVDAEIEELLEKGMEDGVDSNFVSKTVLEKTDHDRFNPLPTDWVMITHLSGMPVYLHKPTRVITLSRPYKMDAPIRNHLIPVSSVPCLYRKRLEEKEKTRIEALEKKQMEVEKSSTVQKIADQILSGVTAGIIENEEDLLLNPEQFNEYCSKVFKFKRIAVKRFSPGEGKQETKKNRRLDNLLHRAGFQGKYEDVKNNTDEHELLITAPSGAVLIDVTPYDQRRRGNKKPFLLNPVGRSTVTVLNEFMQRLVKGKIEYECEDNRSVTCPYKATTWLTMKTAAIINTCGNTKEKLTLLKEQAEMTGSNTTTGVEVDAKKFPIGRGIGHSKKVARLAAARDALSKLIPSLNVNEEYNCVGVQTKNEETGESKGFEEEATELFDKVNILSKNLTHLCIKFGITKPMSLLKDAVSRSIRWNGMNLETRKDFVGNGGQLSKITLVLGDFSETSEGNGVKAATQTASQKLLAKLHPELTSYGSFLRLYGGMENKVAKDEAKKQHDQVVRLQNQGSLLQPNHAVLDKLKEEMMNITLVHPPRQFLYGLSSSEVPFKPELTTSIGVQTDFMPRMMHQTPHSVLMPPIYPPTQLLAPLPPHHPVQFNMPPNVPPMFYPPVAAPPIPPESRKRHFVPDGDQPNFPPKKPPPFP